MWESCVHHPFACFRRIRGVQAECELKELRRDHDSTGLRAAPKLITPLLRCASLAKHTCLQRASETTQSRKQKREPPGSPFVFQINGFESRLRRILAMMAVMSGAAVSMVVAIMRRSRIGGLSLRRSRTILWRGLHCRRLSRGPGEEKHWHQQQHPEIPFHGNTPERYPLYNH